MARGCSFRCNTGDRGAGGAGQYYAAMLTATIIDCCIPSRTGSMTTRVGHRWSSTAAQRRSFCAQWVDTPGPRPGRRHAGWRTATRRGSAPSRATEVFEQPTQRRPRSNQRSRRRRCGDRRRLDAFVREHWDALSGAGVRTAVPDSSELHYVEFQRQKNCATNNPTGAGALVSAAVAGWYAFVLPHIMWPTRPAASLRIPG